MKKIALLLAVLLAFGLLAGCNAEEDKKKEPDYVVPGYMINLYTGDGWTQVEESQYDLELTKDGVTLAVIGYVPTDFVDMPAAEDLYQESLDELFEEMTDVAVKEKKTSYKVEGNKVISTLYSAKSGDSTKQYYCFMVSFDDDAGSVAFVMFSASAKVMKEKKADFKAIVDKMDANGVAMTQEELDAMVEEELGLAEDELNGEEAPDEGTPEENISDGEASGEINTEEEGTPEDDSESTDVVISDTEESAEGTEETTPEATEETAPESTEATTGETAPESTEATTEETVPESTEATTGETTPETTEASATPTE